MEEKKKMFLSEFIQKVQEGQWGWISSIEYLGKTLREHFPLSCIDKWEQEIEVEEHRGNDVYDSYPFRRGWSYSYLWFKVKLSRPIYPPFYVEGPGYTVNATGGKLQPMELLCEARW